MIRRAAQGFGALFGGGAAAFAVKTASTRSVAVATPNHRDTSCAKKTVVVSTAKPSAQDWQALVHSWDYRWSGTPATPATNITVPGFHSLRGADAASFNAPLVTPTKALPAETAAAAATDDNNDTKGAVQDQDQLQLMTIAQPAAVGSTTVVQEVSVLDLARVKMALDALPRPRNIIFITGSGGSDSLNLHKRAINRGNKDVIIMELGSLDLSAKLWRVMMAIEAAPSAPSAAGSLSLFEPAPFQGRCTHAINFKGFGDSCFRFELINSIAGGCYSTKGSASGTLELAAVGGCRFIELEPLVAHSHSYANVVVEEEHDVDLCSPRWSATLDASPRHIMATLAAAGGGLFIPAAPALRAISMVPQQPATAAALDSNLQQGDPGFVRHRVEVHELLDMATKAASNVGDQQRARSVKGTQRARRGDNSKAIGVCGRRVQS